MNTVVEVVVLIVCEVFLLLLGIQLLYNGRFGVTKEALKAAVKSYKSVLASDFARGNWSAVRNHSLAVLALATLLNVAWAFFSVLYLHLDCASFMLSFLVFNTAALCLRHLLLLVSTALVYAAESTQQDDLTLQRKLETGAVSRWLWAKLLLTVLLWAGAGATYGQRLADWRQSAAVSRESNSDCSILSFYDWHDLWHWLAAAALLSTLHLLAALPALPAQRHPYPPLPPSIPSLLLAQSPIFP